MAIKESRNPEHNHVPKDYEDLYLHYIVGRNGDSLCKKLIRNFLPYSTPDERDVLAHDVFLRLMDHNMLERFDPEKANFGGVIFFVTRTIVVGHLSRRSRSPLGGLRAGSVVESTESGEFVPGVYQLNTLESGVDEEARVDARLSVRRLLEYADARSKQAKNTRDRGLKTMLQLLLQGRDVNETAKALNVTPSTIHSWIQFVREQAGETVKQEKV